VAAACHLFVAHETGQNRETCGIRRRPSIGPPIALREIEDRAGIRFPSLRRRIPSRPVQLEQYPPIAIDDQHVSIAPGPAAGLPALDVVRLRLRFVRDWIAGAAAETGIPLAAVTHERDRHACL